MSRSTTHTRPLRPVMTHNGLDFCGPVPLHILPSITISRHGMMNLGPPCCVCCRCISRLHCCSVHPLLTATPGDAGCTQQHCTGELDQH
jgi:hypothetical protein